MPLSVFRQRILDYLVDGGFGSVQGIRKHLRTGTAAVAPAVDALVAQGYLEQDPDRHASGPRTVIYYRATESGRRMATAQPPTISQDGVLLDGQLRYEAARKAKE